MQDTRDKIREIDEIKRFQNELFKSIQPLQYAKKLNDINVEILNGKFVSVD